jgi:hypothetical protein
MSGWTDWIFGNLPPQPQHPASRGALLGAGYQGMPDTRQTITDERTNPHTTEFMRQGPLGEGQVLTADAYKRYPPSMGSAPATDAEAASMGVSGALPYQTSNLGAGPEQESDNYRNSFQPNYHPSMQAVRNTPAPYQKFPVGPQMPSLGQDWNPQTDLPPITRPEGLFMPNDPRYRPMPSPSGPHPQQNAPDPRSYTVDQPNILNAAQPGTNLMSLPPQLQYLLGGSQ